MLSGNLKLLALIVCLIGCCWQLELIFSHYFSYHVSTVITVKPYEKTTPPSLLSCFSHSNQTHPRLPLEILRRTPSAYESFLEMSMIGSDNQYHSGQWSTHFTIRTQLDSS